jgi:hypothetical protein
MPEKPMPAEELIEKVIRGVRFADGIEVSEAA